MRFKSVGWCSGLFGAVFAACLAVTSPAQQSAVTFNIPFVSGNTHPSTVGWVFSNSVPIDVLALGFYNFEGLQEADHEIGIWNTTGTLIASTSVFPTDNLLPDSFRYEGIAETLLEPGTYTIGAGYAVGSDSYFGEAAGFATAPGINYITDASEVGSSFEDPTMYGTGTMPDYFGPNFQFIDAPQQPSGTPEPGAPAILIGSVLSTAAAVRGRKRIRNKEN